MSRWNIRFHPLIQPEGRRVPVAEVLPHGPVALLRPSVLTRRRGGVDAEQEVDVRVGRHRGGLLARRPRVPRVRATPSERRLRALGRLQPPAVARDGPRPRVRPSLDHVLPSRPVRPPQQGRYAAFMDISSERVFNGSGKGYLPAGAIGSRSRILSERLKAGTESKRLKRGIDLRRCP